MKTTYNVDKKDKEILLLDVDGVVSDFVGSLCQKFNLHRNDFVSWNIDANLPKEIVAEVNTFMAGREFWENMPTLDNAKYIRALQSRFDLVFVSAPWTAAKEWCDARNEWLKKHFGEDTKFIATYHKEYVMGNIFVDDKPSNIYSWLTKNNGKKAFLMDASYNRDDTALNRIESLSFLLE